MLDVSAVVKAGQIANESDSPDRAPANIFDETVVDLGFRSNHHRSPGELAVAKSQKQAAASVIIPRAVDSNRKRASVESRERQKNRCLISNLSPRTDPPGA